MFTGIVQGMCTVQQIQESNNFRKVKIQLDELADGLRKGASVAVNGTCLTVAAIEQELITFEVIQETLQRTNLDRLTVHCQVNIERSVCLGDEIGGHLVMGHVDCTGYIVQVEESPNNWKVWICHAEEWNRYLIPKGWIAIDGVSLTVIDVLTDRFSVGLIPETRQRTTLGIKTTGQPVNLEFDQQIKVLVMTIERCLPSYFAKQSK